MSKERIFSVYDNKAEVYGAPILCITSGVAMRMFSELVNDPTSFAGRHPADYELCELGVFDNNTGFFESYKKVLNHGPGTRYVISKKVIDDMFDDYPEVNDITFDATDDSYNDDLLDKKPVPKKKETKK